MPRRLDLEGQRFGRWQVVEYVAESRWMCVCDCGTTRDVSSKVLRLKKSTHCGCAQPSVEERFWSNVYIDTTGHGCWEWTAARLKGYGVFALSHRKAVKAHRFAWESQHGPVLDGLCVLHRCDHPPCVRPDHLFLGTNPENTADRHAKGRSARGERAGLTKLTAAQVLAIRALSDSYRTKEDIGAEFGVTGATVGHIWRRRTWKHLS